jgi:hypothetical protein
MNIIIIIICGYYLCSWLAYGLTFAYFQRKWPNIAFICRKSDHRFAMHIAIFGPIGLIVTIMCGGIMHGVLWPSKLKD